MKSQKQGPQSLMIDWLKVYVVKSELRKFSVDEKFLTKCLWSSDALDPDFRSKQFGLKLG